jgi:glyoxylase-like metal-dependent hydrolase (beta-lactamase superfamily II)
MNVHALYDAATYTLTYVVYDLKSKDAIVIDPVLDFDPASGKISEDSMKLLVQFIQEHSLRVHAILETHAHADHITSATRLKKYFPEAQIAIGARITEVQEVFRNFFNLKDMPTDASQFDLLLHEETNYSFGTIALRAIYTPGHTPACASYVIDDMLFTGDTIFMPDYGTGRCDFPKGSAEALYDSIQKLYQLPDSTRVFVGHDYQPGGRELQYQTTIGAQKKENVQLNAMTSKEDFVAFRQKRDATLAAPRLLLPSVQLNIQAGRMPEKEDNAVAYLKIPLRGEAL